MPGSFCRTSSTSAEVGVGPVLTVVAGGTVNIAKRKPSLGGNHGGRSVGAPSDGSTLHRRSEWDLKLLVCLFHLGVSYMKRISGRIQVARAYVIALFTE